MPEHNFYDDDDERPADAYRGNQFVADVREASAFGRVIVQPSIHFQRIFGLFDVSQRIKFLEQAYRESVSLGKRRASIRQFVVEILSSEPEVPEELLNEPDYLPRSEAHRERLLKDYYDRKSDAVLRGEDYRGLSKLLVNTLFNEGVISETESFDKFFAAALGSSILLPEQAAAVATCVEESRSDFRRFEKDATYLIDDARIIKRESFESHSEYLTSRERTSELQDIFSSYQLEHPRIEKHQASIVRPDELLERFRLQIVAGGLYVPIRRTIIFAKTMEEAIRKAESDKSSLLSMDPRRFEEFMGELFKRLGFDVELTQATRDGGADLLCLRDMNGIPTRMAVEIKRYKESRPIDITLVRAFVGANEQHKANQLVYVTTSSYTKPALDFAKTCSPYFLTLKKYDQIQSWCREALAQPTRLL